MANHILMVDDSREFIIATRAFLEEEGYEVTEAHDGIQALAQVAQKMPDLIILDVMMPRLDGWETLTVLQSQEDTAQIPVLMLTALNEAENVKEGFDLGCTWFYTKPITDYDDLLLVVRRILETTQAPQDA